MNTLHPALMQAVVVAASCLVPQGAAAGSAQRPQILADMPGAVLLPVQFDDVGGTGRPGQSRETYGGTAGMSRSGDSTDPGDPGDPGDPSPPDDDFGGPDTNPTHFDLPDRPGSGGGGGRSVSGLQTPTLAVGPAAYNRAGLPVPWTICNRNKANPLTVVIAWQDNSAWKSSGFVRIAPDDCQWFFGTRRVAAWLHAKTARGEIAGDARFCLNPKSGTVSPGSRCAAGRKPAEFRKITPASVFRQQIGIR
ncbi:DUF1036 domain-containing protein [Mangrovicoccus sp. HB161399]|uniref:DUF1036 domain-containing protein n=1 Tax=Mangrovicoccus sp. HB161399 TaxID=2720392 RepID=UPI0015540B8A|nr:DUF1036 domain-containing protein [Mangrovicoccus sp. HB161399]